MNKNKIKISPNTVLAQHKQGRDATPEEQSNFELQIQSQRVILSALTGEMFLYGTDLYDEIEVEYKELWNRWGRRSASRMHGRYKAWEQKVRVDQRNYSANTTQGTMKSFYSRHYYSERMKNVRTQVVYSIRLSLGRRGIVDYQELIAKCFLYQVLAKSITDSIEGFADFTANFHHNITNTPVDMVKRVLAGKYAVATIPHPQYMADIVFRFITKEMFEEMYDESEIQRALTAYKNAYDSSWNVKDMIECMEMNGDPEAADFRKELGLDKATPDQEALREELNKKLHDKLHVERWKLTEEQETKR